jgi:uncharacterized membrane protein
MRMDTDTVGDGPIDVVMLSFPGNQFNGAIAPALRDLVVRGLVRVVDLLFVVKDDDGTVGSIELAGLGADLEPSFVEDVAAGMDPGSSVAVIAVENLWAVPFIEAVRGSGGELVDQFRVPSEVVAAVRDAAQNV